MTPKTLLLLVGLLWPSFTIALKAEVIENSQMRELPIDPASLRDDLKSIVQEAKFKQTLVRVSFDTGIGQNEVKTVCQLQDNKKIITLKVSGDQQSWSENFYYGLQKLGFYFPHPRLQINPKEEDISKVCGKSFSFKPTFKFRGFHLHTLHPSEWVEGFLMDQPVVARQTIRWLARNMQNAFDLSLLRIKRQVLFSKLRPLFLYAKKLGVYPGVSLGIALQQQNSYKLLGIVRSVTGFRSHQVLKNNLQKLIDGIAPSFITLEAGTSEFTPVSYKRNISWMNEAAKQTRKQGIQTFIKVHVSSNQSNDTYGNFNFLPQYCDPAVGVWPHTVMFYSIYDDFVPMYGNNSFSHIKEFMLQEAPKRPTWYYPETSYYIGMDIDAPLFLTTYLTNRADEMNRLNQRGIEGHINFTTGHEVGYWLMDWTLALMANSDHEFDPMAGLKILGEDVDVWQSILEYQDKFIKDKGIISILSFPNFQDELAKDHRIHERNVIKELLNDPELLESEIALLELAMKHRPDLTAVKNESLKTWLTITFNRMDHAYHTRLALKHPKRSKEREHLLQEAKKIRLKMSKIAQEDVPLYPELNVFKKFKNPTSYNYGYGWTAKTLHFWEREEEQVRQERFSPLFMNIWDVLDIIF